jgi:hypothetical protein
VLDRLLGDAAVAWEMIEQGGPLNAHLAGELFDRDFDAFPLKDLHRLQGQPDAFIGIFRACHCGLPLACGDRQRNIRISKHMKILILSFFVGECKPSR